MSVIFGCMSIASRGLCTRTSFRSSKATMIEKMEFTRSMIEKMEFTRSK